MVQLTLEDLASRECRSCGKPLHIERRHSTGRYPFLCSSCRLARKGARRKKTHFARLQRIKEQRSSVLRSLGSKCFVCGLPKQRLELHHRFYEADSVTPEKYHAGHQSGWEKIIREATNHPERFALLCNSCHKFVTWIERQPAMLVRLNQILNRVG